MASNAARGDVRVVIVDDHVSIAEALELALSVEGYDVRRVAVPDAPASPAALVSAIARLRPTVVLLNLDLGPFGDGAPLVAPLVKRGAQVVVLTGQTDRARWGEVLAHGARIVLSKSQPLNDLLATVRRIHQGMPVLDRRDRDELVDAWLERRTHHGVVQDRIGLLTSREREVLGELMRGHAVREIAARGVVSEATVRTQVKSILGKLEVSSQLAAVGLAHRVGWRAPEAVRN
ncbi:response regulator transcription factor [Nocardioides sp.]|uniref:LuxR C-terminal-related transcriptional regulator n=1 Tax=Nocardioides sp. TaxID=35761 RepID=UPI001A2BCC21|nr:response regulator transcription factor [Nocardioides sp.]MBJ7359873.1 response regulator transcription factor [Nocardioides sp.]